MSFLNSLELGDHVFVVYSNQEAKSRDCFSFLKSGFDNNEFLFLMMGSIPKDEIYKKMTKQWNIDNIKEIEDKKDDIIITTPKEWYYPDGDFNTYRILKKLELTFSNAAKRGKKGLRSFIDVTAFFIEGLENALISYDEILEKQFSFPFLSVYAYKMDDIKKMTPQQYALLNTNHGIWIKG